MFKDEEIPLTVIETPRFLRAAQGLMDDEDRQKLVDHLATHPTSGVVMPGTGGVRKLRWGLEGRGKRGGARVIYFYYNSNLPVFALDAYAKNERVDLSPQQRQEFKSFVAQIVMELKRRVS